jgi:hypothetical protein
MNIHVEIFQRTVKDRKSGISYDLLHSWKQGIESQGDKATVITQAVNPQIVNGEMDASTPVSVIFGYGGDTQTGHTKGRRRLVRKFQERMGGVTINFDGGVFNAFGNIGHRDNAHFRCGINSPMRNGDFNNENCPSDRFEKIQKVFNIDVKPWRTDGKHILICTQPKDNWSMDGMDPVEWASRVITEIRKHTDREIKIRPHPNHMNIVPQIQAKHKDIWVRSKMAGNEVPGKSTQKDNYKMSFQEDLDNAWAMVTHNSTAGVDAAVYGVPVYNTDDKALSWDVANHSFDNINNPDMPDRTQWLNNLGYAMWSKSEIEQGLAWQHLKPRVLELIKEHKYK